MAGRFARLLWVPIAVIVAGAPREASADTQVWTALEARVRVTDGSFGLPHEFRWVTESRFAGENGGLHFLLARAGPLWNIASWLQLALNAVAIVEKTDSTTYAPQFRAEVEPSFRWNLGNFRFNDRNRLERRWFLDDESWRYRNQIRMNYQRDRATWIPFLTEEVFFDLSNGGYDENRASMGLAWLAPEGLRIDVAYLMRLREQNNVWSVTNVISFSLSFRPKTDTVIDFGGD